MKALKNDHFRAMVGFFLLLSFFVLLFGIHFLHTHNDCSFHDTCLACNWLVIPLFVFAVILVLLGSMESYEPVLSFVQPVIIKIHRISLYLRAPPYSA